MSTALFTLLASLGLSGCHAVEAKDLIGSYRLKADWGCGGMVLRGDNTFHQEVRVGCSGTPQVLDGTWFPNGSYISQITMKPFLDFDNAGVLTRYQYENLPVVWPSLGPLHIMVNPDAGFRYEKQARE